MLNPEYGVGDIAKELGKKWSDADPETKSKYEAMAEKDKARYERVTYLNLAKSSFFLLKVLLVLQSYWLCDIRSEKSKIFLYYISEQISFSLFLILLSAICIFTFNRIDL